MSEHEDSVEPEDEPETDGDAPAPKRSVMAILMDAAPSAPAKPRLDKNGNPTKWSIDRLDARERVYCYLASFVAAFLAVLVYVTETGNKHLHLQKNQFTPQTILVVGMVAAVLLAGSTYLGRRALVGFVALFTFLAFSGATLIVGLPFLILAGWLLYRSYKVQKDITARIRADREAKDGSPAASRQPRQSRAEMAAARRADRVGGRKKGPAGPQGNKRFTPKVPTRPAPPPPKPSWIERRAEKERSSD